MTKTYPAEIVDGQVRWLGETPPTVCLGRPVDVVVTVRREDLSEAELNARREQLHAALERLRASNPFAEMEDPAAWQKEIRKDKPLVGRE